MTKHAILLLAFLLILTCSYSHSIFPNAPTSIIFVGNGQDSQVGFITDVNNDNLPDFVMTYFQRDYGFSSTTVSGTFVIRLE